VSVDNFDGGGLVGQPSIIYSFEKNDSGEIQIRELAQASVRSAPAAAAARRRD
jgi:hypothetical protein